MCLRLCYTRSQPKNIKPILYHAVDQARDMQVAPLFFKREVDGEKQWKLWEDEATKASIAAAVEFVRNAQAEAEQHRNSLPPAVASTVCCECCDQPVGEQRRTCN